MADVLTNAQPGSAYVWTDDCVEIFIDTVGDGKTYAHFMVNAASVQQDELPGERAVTYGWTAAARRGEDAWSIEVRIPFQDLDVHPPAAGEVWRLNVCRARCPKAEHTCWSPTFAGFHFPDRFGVLAFGNPQVKATHITTGLAEQAQRRKLEIALENAAGASRTVTGQMTVTADGTELARVPLQADLPAGQRRLLEAPYETAQRATLVTAQDPG